MNSTTFFNDPKLKAALLTQLRDDQAADRFIQGTYTQGEGATFKGCFIGCLTRTGDVTEVMRLFNLPIFVGTLGEYFFEALAADKAKELSVPYIEAIPVGVDVSLAWPMFALALMRRMEERNTETRFDLPGVLSAAVEHFTLWVSTGKEPAGAAGAAYAAYAARAAGAAYAEYAARAAGAAYAADAAGAADAADSAHAARSVYAADAAELDWQLSTLLNIYRGMRPTPCEDSVAVAPLCGAETMLTRT